MTKNPHRIVTTDAEIDAAIARAEANPPRTVVAATYDRAEDVIAIRFADGVRLRIPRHLVQGLQDATSDQLERIEIEGPGTGLVWPALGVAHYVPGLVAGVFGTRQWMAEIGRRGGIRRTKAKALAARANGAKGGRPRRVGAEAHPSVARRLQPSRRKK
jgi:uncharacterized protein DUF2442